MGSGRELSVRARVSGVWHGSGAEDHTAVFVPQSAATSAMSRMVSPASSSAREERMRRAAMAARAACPKVAHNPKDAEAWKALGDAAESLGLVDEAKVAFRRARELDPSFLRVPPAPGDNQPASHEVENARRAVTAIVMRHGRRSRISPEDEEKLQAHGNAFFKARKYEDAVTAYSRAISFCPELASLYGNRSAAYYMLKKFKEAAVDAVKACKVDPFYVKGYSRAAKAYLCLGDVEQAKAQLMQARAKGADVEQDLRSISIVEKAKAINGKTLTRENMKLIEKAMEIAPNVEQFKVAMGRVLLTRGKHQEALALCRGLKVDGSKHASEILSIRAEASYLIGDTKAAERYFAQALASDPKNLHAKRFMDTVQAVQNNKQKGNQAFQFGRWEEAYQHYTAAMNVDPNVRNSLVAQCACNRAAVLIKLENLEDALVDCTYAIELDETYTKAYLRRAHIHSELENFEDALRDFQKVQELDPQSPDIQKLVKEAANTVRKHKYVDFYHLLEVRRTATEVEIRKAYKKACLKYHPDKNAHRTLKEKRDADRKFRHLQDAYNILLDVQKRALYDRGFSAEDIDSGVADTAEDFGDMNMGNGSTGYSSDRRRYSNRG